MGGDFLGDGMGGFFWRGEAALLFFSVVNPCFGHAFAHPAFFYKCFFQGLHLLAEQVGYNFNEANHGVGAYFRIVVFNGVLE